MKSMGFLEGFVSCNEIHQWYVNFYSGLFDGGDPLPEVIAFLVRNHDYVRYQAEQNYRQDEFWFHIRGLLYQLDGIVEGTNDGCPASSSSEELYLPSLHFGAQLVHFLLMNANGDLYQIAQKFHQEEAPIGNHTNFEERRVFSRRKHFQSMGKVSLGDFPSNLNPNILRHEKSNGTSTVSEFPWSKFRYRHDHCSAIIKILPDKSDVVFAHNTWDDYEVAFPRIIKHMRFPHLTLSLFRDSEALISNSNIRKNSLKDAIIHFSSSPGLLSSVDDFFLINSKSKLAVTETT